MTEKQLIENLIFRIENLEAQVANLTKQPKPIYDLAPYWLNPDFKMPIAS